MRLRWVFSPCSCGRKAWTHKKVCVYYRLRLQSSSCGLGLRIFHSRDPTCKFRRASIGLLHRNLKEWYFYLKFTQIILITLKCFNALWLIVIYPQKTSLGSIDQWFWHINEVNASFSFVLTINIFCMQPLTKESLPAGSNVMRAIHTTFMRQYFKSVLKSFPSLLNRSLLYLRVEHLVLHLYLCNKFPPFIYEINFPTGCVILKDASSEGWGARRRRTLRSDWLLPNQLHPS